MCPEPGLRARRGARNPGPGAGESGRQEPGAWDQQPSARGSWPEARSHEPCEESAREVDENRGDDGRGEENGDDSSVAGALAEECGKYV
jgi:hypothetical protein